MCIVPKNDIKVLKNLILFIGFFFQIIGFSRICFDLIPLIIVYRIVILDTFILYIIQKQFITHYILQFG